MTHNNEQWEEQLQIGLEQMDGWVAPSVIDAHRWEQLIVEEHLTQRRNVRRELSIFWTVAVVIWIMGLLSLTQLPIVFVVVQAVVLVGFPLYGVINARKKVTAR